MITDEDIRSLENVLKAQSISFKDLRDRHHKALKKILLMELLLTMDVPSGRIKLSESNIKWLLRNVQINNSNHVALEQVIGLLKEMVNVDGSN